MLTKQVMLHAAGDLTVAGTTTTISSTNLAITDKEIILANGSADGNAADGGGLKLGTSNIGIVYNHNSGVQPRFDVGMDLKGTQGLYIGGNSVLSSDTLGSGIVNSSLTSVGTLTGLGVEGLSTLRTISEDIVSLSGANATVEHNFSTSAIWYHTGVSGNFTVNLTNVPTQNKAYSIALIINQGGTGYLPNAAVNSASRH